MQNSVLIITNNYIF